MKTKFIGLEGFNEIESLSTKNRKAYGKKSVELTTAQKTVRFAKRATAICTKSIKKNSAKLASLIGKSVKRATAHGNSANTSVARTAKAKKPQLSLIDKCYLENRKGNITEFNSSAKEAITRISSGSKKFAHSAPQTGYRTHAVIKKKAVLAVVASAVAIMLSCVTVAGAVAETTATSEIEENSITVTSTSDEAIVSPEELIGNGLNVGVSGLYIDGELIGATADVDALNSALEQVLIDYRAEYDDETTTVFANDVVVTNGQFNKNDIMTVEEIMALAEGKFSIALSTDIVYTKEIAYETETEYDDSEYSSYEEVKTEGKNGTEEVTIRTTYVDGVQTDAVETDTKIIEEVVNEVVIKGSKDGITASSEENISSGSSTGSFIWPVPYTHSISSYYEWRWGRMHWGIDIADSGIYGQDIVASDGGTVTFSGDIGDGYGYYVIIDHGNGYQTLYAHCSSLAVSEGQYVSQGETIAYVGSTGYSTGPHLHFEVRQGSDKLDPLNFVG